MIRWRRWLLGLVSLLVLVAVGIIGTGWWTFTSEQGSRWLIGKAIGYADLDIELRRLSGTLQHGLRVEQIRYEDVDRRIEVIDLELQIDWSDTGMAQLAISRAVAQKLKVETLTETAPEPEPLDLELPPLPLRITASAIELDAADLDGFEISGIAAHELVAADLAVKLGSGGATFSDYRVQVSSLDAQLRDDLPLSVNFTWQAAESSWSGEGSASGSLSRLAVEHELRGEYPLSSVGTIDLADPTGPVFDVVSSFDQWMYEEWVATDARVRVLGTFTDYSSTLAVSVTDGGLFSAEVSGEVTGNGSGLTSVELTTTTFDGDAQVTGSVLWAPEPQVDLSTVGTNMDLSALTAGFATRLDFDLRVLATAADSFSLEVRELAGTYRGQPINASGTVSRVGEQWRCQSCDASIGDNRVQAGVVVNNRQISGRIDVQARAIQQVHPDLSGEARAQGTLRGTIDMPILSGTASARDLVIDGVAIGSGGFRISGSPTDLDVDAYWALEGNALRVAARLQHNDDTVNGRVSSAEIEQRETGLWTLAEPVSFAVTPERTSVGESLWSNGDTSLRIGNVVRDSESLAAEAELTGAPLEWIAAHGPEEVTVNGFADAFLSLRQTSGEWSGRLEWQQRETVLRVRLIDGELFDVAVPTATARGRLAAGGATLQARLEADGGVAVDLNATASELSRAAEISAQLKATGQEFGWVAAFVPDIDEIIGSVNADLRVLGRVDDPQLRGELRISDGEVVLPAFNVPLTDIQARLVATSSDSLNVTGTARAGEGDVVIGGTITDVLSPDPKLEIDVRGNGATVLDWPDYLLVASPDLSLSGAGNLYEVDGRVRMDRADILVRELPEGAVSPSADVTVAGRPDSDTRPGAVSGVIDLELTEAVHVRAFGLDTNLVGELRITLPPGRGPRGNGELSLAGGFFEMYGQRLEVERGTMLFSGPLDNPFVDVRVVRDIDGPEGEVSVGVNIIGQADSLVSTLFSDPAMSESEILSYLVTGRPLGQASAVDGETISDAAFALGLRQADVIINQVGRAIGLDELGLEGSSQDSAAFIAGKQVTSNLYARFRYRVFSNLGEILLRYSISDTISVEVGAGEFQSVDVQYTIERD